MPRGLSKIKKSHQEAQARKKAFDEAGPGVRKVIVKDGETIRIRPLEQGEEVWSVYTHELPKKPGQKYGDICWCLDQENTQANCAGCNRNIKRGERVTLNVIWFNAPKWKKGPDGKPLKDDNNNLIYDGVEDVVAVWNASMEVGGRLEYLQEVCEQKHHVSGITNAVLTVKREGSGKDTKYMIDIDEVVDPKPHEIELFKTKEDPRRVIRKLTLGDMERVFSGGGMPSGDSTPSSDSDNAFERAAAGPASRGAFGGAAATTAEPQPAQQEAAEQRSSGVNFGAFG